MADLTTAQKAAIVVHNGGAAVTNFTATSSDDTVAQIGDYGASVFGVGAGTATIHVSAGSQSGALAVTVTDAPLTVALGTPVAK